MICHIEHIEDSQKSKNRCQRGSTTAQWDQIEDVGEGTNVNTNLSRRQDRERCRFSRSVANRKSSTTAASWLSPLPGQDECTNHIDETDTADTRRDASDDQRHIEMRSIHSEKILHDSTPTGEQQPRRDSCYQEPSVVTVECLRRSKKLTSSDVDDFVRQCRESCFDEDRRSVLCPDVDGCRVESQRTSCPVRHKHEDTKRCKLSKPVWHVFVQVVWYRKFSCDLFLLDCLWKFICLCRLSLLFLSSVATLDTTILSSFFLHTVLFTVVTER